MINLNDLMAWLDWNNSPLVQQRGIELVQKVESLEPFLQPMTDSYSKNCGIIVR